MIPQQQRELRGSVFAHAVNTGFRIALINKPGCPPPIDTFIPQHRVGGLTNQTCALRTPANTPGALNNVAVPGATLLSPTGTGPWSGHARQKRAHHPDTRR